ncbi:MAG: type II toxin-antitoxin system RelE/ParE family toxin [Anaerolineae bacterium]
MASQKPWIVEYYEDARGRAPALEFLDSLSPGDKAALVRVIDLLEEFGVSLRAPYAKPIESDLWELRGGAGRLFYVAVRDRRFIILHGYRKKTRKAPLKRLR